MNPVTFDVAGISIAIEENDKFLGVQIDHIYVSDRHISEICKQKRRSIKIRSHVCSNFLDEKRRLSAYHSLILSHFNYCNIVWHHCDTHNTIKVEKIKKRVLRVILNDYDSTYDELLQKTGQSLMYTSRWDQLSLKLLKVCINWTLHFCMNYSMLKTNA